MFIIDDQSILGFKPTTLATHRAVSYQLYRLNRDCLVARGTFNSMFWQRVAQQCIIEVKLASGQSW